MKILKIVGISLVVLIAVFLVVGFLLPDKVHVERSIDIYAPQQTIYSEITSFKNFNAWSPWHEMEPTAKYTYSGPEVGVGAKMTWAGNKVGNGSQEIVDTKEFMFVKTKLDFGQQSSFATWNLTTIGKGVKVTWGMDSEFKGNLIGRYFGLFLDKMVGNDYEKGLSSLKKILETKTSN